MTLARCILCGILSVSLGSGAQAAKEASSAPAELLSHLTGNWVLQGIIAGKQTTHDVQASWVLNSEYVQLHEVSHEKNGSGKPAYEAIVYLAWDPKTKQYSCLWLDSTAGGGLSAESIAHANVAGDSIPLLFTLSASDQIRTTSATIRLRILGNG